MNSKFCGRCGRVNVEQSNFCLECGLDLRNANQPANNQGTSSYQPNLQTFSSAPTPNPNFVKQNPFQMPPANNFQPFKPPVSAAPPFQQNFNPQPGNFSAASSGFQQPVSQPAPLAQTVATQKQGAGGKLLGVLGALFAGGLFLLKGGFVLLRLSHLGGLGFLIGIALIIVVVAVKMIFRRG